jgi:hypothetical protein
MTEAPAPRIAPPLDPDFRPMALIFGVAFMGPELFGVPFAVVDVDASAPLPERLVRLQERMAAENPEAAVGTVFHLADEHQKRHGQAVAAAILPELR